MKPFSALVLIAASAAAVSPDRHPGIYEFAPANPAYCREQAAQQKLWVNRPQRLGDLPPSYTIRLKDHRSPKQEACVRLRRVR